MPDKLDSPFKKPISAITFSHADFLVIGKSKAEQQLIRDISSKFLGFGHPTSSL